MTWVLAIACAGALAAAAVGVALRRDARGCAVCGAPFRDVSPASARPGSSYDVVACSGCGRGAARVQGLVRDTGDAAAWCPACHQHTLTVRCEGASDGAVGVHESCALCGHTAQYTVSTPRLARVLPFRHPLTRRPPPDPR